MASLFPRLALPCLSVGVFLLGSACNSAPWPLEGRSFQGPTLDASTADAWGSYVRPDEADAAWRQIPWRTTFSDGLRDAAAETKPLLLWGMNGHPLGAT